MPRCASLRPKFAPLQKGTPGPELSPSKNNKEKKRCVQTGLDAEFERGRWRRIIKTTLGTSEELLPAVGDKKKKILQGLGWKCNWARRASIVGQQSHPSYKAQVSTGGVQTGSERSFTGVFWGLFLRYTGQNNTEVTTRPKPRYRPWLCSTMVSLSRENTLVVPKTEQ